MTLVSGMSWTYTGAITFNATATGKTIITAAVALANNITFNGVGGGWTLQDNLSTGATNTILLTAGALNTNAKTVTAGIFNSNGAVARTATLTNSTFNLTGILATVWQTTTTTNGTFTVTGLTVNCTADSQTVRVGSVVLPTLNMTGGGVMLLAAGTFGNVTVISIGSGVNIFDSTFAVGVITVTGTLTLTGINQVSSLLVNPASAQTITAAAVVLTNVAFLNVTGAGTATWSGTQIADWGNNHNITFTTPVIRYWVGNGGNWSDMANHWSASSGGAPNATMPLPQDSCFVDENSFSLPGQTLTLDYRSYCALSFAGVTNSPSLSLITGGIFFGSLTLDPSLTLIGNGASSIYTFLNQTGTANLTSAGLALPVSIQMGIATSASLGTLSLGDDLTLTANGGQTGQLIVASGTFTANNHNVTLGNALVATGSVVHTRAVTMGTGTWTLSALSGTIWNIATTGLTLTTTGSLIKVLASSPTGVRTFGGAGIAYNGLTWAAEGAASQLNITGANTFGTVTVAADTAPRILQLPQSVTQTMTGLTLNGTSGNLLSVISGLSGTRSTISIASGVVADTFLSLKDQAATGGAAFAATSSVDAGNNSGWVITP